MYIHEVTCNEKEVTHLKENRDGCEGVFGRRERGNVITL